MGRYRRTPCQKSRILKRGNGIIRGYPGKEYRLDSIKTVHAASGSQIGGEKVKAKPIDILYRIYRVVILVLFMTIFFSSLNPARICGLMSKTISLLTVGFSYGSMISNAGRALDKGWILASTMKLDHYSAMICCLGIFACAAAACISAGNGKMKRLGNLLSLVGSIASLASLWGMYTAYQQISLTEKPEKVEPIFPPFIYGMAVILMIVIVFSLVLMIGMRRQPKEDHYEMETQYRLFLMLLPFLLLTFIFCYLPLWGWRYAFFDYHAGESLSMQNFVGFKWFRELVGSGARAKDIIRVMKNTLIMSFLGLGTSWLPMVFAIFLSEVKHSKFRRFVQTFTTIPNFISWILVFSIANTLFATDGFLSSVMVNLGIWDSGKNLLMSGSHTYLKMWAWGTWKGLGWNAIIYIAGISGIDQQLYEAATVDGAGRFQKMWHVTIPGLMPTFMVLLLMGIAGILSNGMDQYLVFETTANHNDIEVLDLYVYNMGIVNGFIPLSTVVGMLKSIISVILLFSANAVSKGIRGESIF